MISVSRKSINVVITTVRTITAFFDREAVSAAALLVAASDVSDVRRGTQMLRYRQSSLSGL